MVILRKGEKLYSGKVDGMMASHGFFELKSDNNERLKGLLKEHDGFSEIKEESGLVIAFPSEEMNAGDLNRYLFEKGLVLSHLQKKKESLEEQFLTLTERQTV